MKRISSKSTGPMFESLEDRAFFSVSPMGDAATSTNASTTGATSPVQEAAKKAPHKPLIIMIAILIA